MTTPQKNSTSEIIRIGATLVPGWLLLRKIHKSYGKRAFWISYGAVNAFSTYHTWPQQIETWNRLKATLTELREQKKRELVARERLAKILGDQP